MIHFTRAMLALSILALAGAVVDLIFGGPDCSTDWAAVGILFAVIGYTAPKALKATDEEDETGPREPYP